MMRDPYMIWLAPHVSPFGSFYVPPTDAQWEAMWRTRVKANEESRKTPIPPLPDIPDFIASECAFFKRQI